MEVLPFSDEYLAGIIGLHDAQGWDRLPSNPARAKGVLTAPGVICIVAVDEGEVVGAAHMFTDGAIQAYLCSLVVSEGRRREGIGSLLMEEICKRSGAAFIDLFAGEGSEAFYDTLEHKRLPGYRILL